VFGGDMELDAHIDVLVTPQRMRLILLPTPGMPQPMPSSSKTSCSSAAGRTRRAAAEQRSTLAQSWVTYYLPSAALGAGADPAQGVPREGSGPGTANTEVLIMAGFILRGLIAALGSGRPPRSSRASPSTSRPR
jgi:hypothetical protein